MIRWQPLATPPVASFGDAQQPRGPIPGRKDVKRRDTSNRQRTAPLLPETFSERSLKGSSISHVVALDDKVTTMRKTGVYGTWLDTLANPYARFSFKYTNRTNLECIGLIPEASRFENMTRAELLMELKRKMAVGLPPIRAQRKERAVLTKCSERGAKHSDQAGEAGQAGGGEGYSSMEL